MARARSATQREKFSRSWLEKLPIPKTKREQWYDTKCPALGIKIEPSGQKVFFWYHAVCGRPTWKKIGSFPAIPLDDARAKAEEYSAKLAAWAKEQYQGPNPFDDTPISEEPTLSQLIDDYIARRTLMVPATSKDPLEVGIHALKLEQRARRIRWVRQKYLKKFEHLKLRSISQKMIFNLHIELAEKHGQVAANRVVTHIRTLFNWARKAGLFKGANPAAEFERFEETERERFLQPDELTRLMDVLDEEGDTDLTDFIRLALATGMRKSNVTGMAWQHVNLAEQIWTIPTSKNGKPVVVDLLPPVMKVLERRLTVRVEGIPWVFPSDGRSGHVEDFKKGFRRLLKRAKITNCTQHDLRRTFGSYQAIAGVPLQKIAATLGHRGTGATEIYARLNREATRQAMTSGAKMMEEMMKERVKLPA